MNKLTKIIGAMICTASMLFSMSAYAGHYDYAKVLRAKPIYKTVRVSVPQQECWNEQVVHQAESNDNVGGMIIGGIIGGAIGNRFGKGNGNKAAIAAGTLLGAGIGQNMSRNNPRMPTYTTTEQRCRTVNNYHEEERIEGYKVKYMYKGQIYHTTTNSHPGKRLRVMVTVTPAL